MADVHHSTRTCRVCNEEKRLDTGFYPNSKKRLDGGRTYSHVCKSCTSKMTGEKYRSRRDADQQFAAKAREYRRAHKEKCRRAAGARPIDEVRASAEAKRRSKEATAKNSALNLLARHYSAHVSHWRKVIRARENYRTLSQDPEYRAMKAAKKRERLANDAQARARANEYMKRWLKTPKGMAFQERQRNSESGKAARRQAERKRSSTPKGILDYRIGHSIRASIRGKKNGVSWQTLVGYTLAELQTHIERQFLKGMGWHNRDKWHIDHIVPKSSFTYETPDDPEFKACWALANLRPLWAEDNMKKSDNRITLL